MQSRMGHNALVPSSRPDSVPRAFDTGLASTRLPCIVRAFGRERKQKSPILCVHGAVRNAKVPSTYRLSEWVPSSPSRSCSVRLRTELVRPIERRLLYGCQGMCDEITGDLLRLLDLERSTWD